MTVPVLNTIPNLILMCAELSEQRQSLIRDIMMDYLNMSSDDISKTFNLIVTDDKITIPDKCNVACQQTILNETEELLVIIETVIGCPKMEEL